MLSLVTLNTGFGFSERNLAKSAIVFSAFLHSVISRAILSTAGFVSKLMIVLLISIGIFFSF